MSADCNNNKYKGLNQNEALICPKNPYRIYELEDIRAGLRNSIDPMIASSMGLCGVSPILSSGSGLVVDNFYAIVILRDAVINVDTSKVVTGWAASLANLTGTLTAGTVIYIQLTEIQVTSGLIQAMIDPFR